MASPAQTSAREKFLAMIAAKKGKKGSKVPAKKKMSRAETLAALAAAKKGKK
jgi:hypothetical protein